MEGILKVILSQMTFFMLNFCFLLRQTWTRLTAIASSFQTGTTTIFKLTSIASKIFKKGNDEGDAWPGLWMRHEATEVYGASDGGLAAAAGPLQTRRWGLMTARIWKDGYAMKSSTSETSSWRAELEGLNIRLQSREVKLETEGTDKNEIGRKGIQISSKPLPRSWPWD